MKLKILIVFLFLQTSFLAAQNVHWGGVINVTFNDNIYDIQADKDNNLILEAHTPISEGVLNHLRSSGINQLYFDPSKMLNKDNGPAQKLIISDELINEAYDHTKNILDEMRETFTRSPGDGISKGLIDKSRTLVDKIITPDLKQPAKRPLNSGLVTLKAESEFGYSPTQMEETFRIMQEELGI